MAELFHLPRGHGGVAAGGRFVEPRGLDVPRFRHPGTDGGGRFPATAVGGKFAEVDERDLDMEIDAVEQRPRDPLAVVLDLPGGAAALAFEVAVVAAGVWVSF